MDDAMKLSVLQELVTTVIAANDTYVTHLSNSKMLYYRLEQGPQRLYETYVEEGTGIPITMRRAFVEEREAHKRTIDEYSASVRQAECEWRAVFKAAIEAISASVPKALEGIVAKPTRYCIGLRQSLVELNRLVHWAWHDASRTTDINVRWKAAGRVRQLIEPIATFVEIAKTCGNAKGDQKTVVAIQLPQLTISGMAKYVGRSDQTIRDACDQAKVGRGSPGRPKVFTPGEASRIARKRAESKRWSQEEGDKWNAILVAYDQPTLDQRLKAARKPSGN